MGETWAMTEKNMKRLSTWVREILRRIYGPVVEQGMWRIRTNNELRELCKDLNAVMNIIKKKLEWIEHVVRMDQGRTVKKILLSKPKGSRRRERPRRRCLENVEKDMRKMKIKRWRRKADEREEWASVINEVKALRAS
jgi:hypothetical protein